MAGEGEWKRKKSKKEIVRLDRTYWSAAKGRVLYLAESWPQVSGENPSAPPPQESLLLKKWCSPFRWYSTRGRDVEIRISWRGTLAWGPEIYTIVWHWTLCNCSPNIDLQSVISPSPNFLPVHFLTKKSEGEVTQQWLESLRALSLKRRRAPSPRMLLQTEPKRGKDLYCQESIPLITLQEECPPLKHHTPGRRNVRKIQQGSFRQRAQICTIVWR
jgi:hypothetical protein